MDSGTDINIGYDNDTLVASHMSADADVCALLFVPIGEGSNAMQRIRCQWQMD
jgi:hypothetical protein